MELPLDVMIHNTLVGMKGSRGRLLQVHSEGFFELNCLFGDKTHRVLMPIGETVLIAREAEAEAVESIEVER